MDLGLKGRTAVVCGASAGIGLACAESLAGEGANVAMVARGREQLQREADRLGGLAIRADVTNPRDLERVVERTVEAFSGIDVLVNNGPSTPTGGALATDDEQLEQAVEALLLSRVRLTRLCLPHLEKSPAGRIVNVESTSVFEPIPTLALSNAVRPGAVGWFRTLADEVGARGITVNAVAPGRIRTPLTERREGGEVAGELPDVPLRRFGTAREVGDVVCFLASDRAAYITGTVVRVDGGRVRSLP